MNEINKNQVLSVLNRNKIQVSDHDDICMGLGHCNIKCMRVKNTPGSYLSKSV